MSVCMSVRLSVCLLPKPPNSQKSIIPPYHYLNHHTHNITHNITHSITHNIKHNITTQHYHTTPQNITHTHNHAFMLLERLLSFSACYIIWALLFVIIPNLFIVQYLIVKHITSKFYICRYIQYTQKLKFNKKLLLIL